MGIPVNFNVEEILAIATVLDDSPHKTRHAVISRMELGISGSIVSDLDREFTQTCIGKLRSITDNDFGNINFLAAWALVGADEHNER